MLWVIEGCDGAGKTTLVERLSSFGHDVEVLHRGPMRGSAIEEYEDDLEDYWPGCERHVVCDRWHLGELVYGPLLRGESRLSVPELRHVEKFLQRRGAVVLHVMAPADVVEERLRERGDDLVRPEQVTNIIDAYHDILPYSRLPVNSFDGTAEPAMQDVLNLVQHATAHEIACLRLTNFMTYIGPPNASILLLGERRNDTHRRAAFVPEPATSGRFLLEHLTEEIHIACGIANALEEDVVTLWETLGQPAVVALGKEAAAECRRAEVPFGEVPHPQYIRRFHAHSGAAYGRAIREAALFHRSAGVDVFRH